MGKPDIWMPLYIADYFADTQHLTTEQHGAYICLLMTGWMRGGVLPADDAQLAAITRLSLSAWKKHKTVLLDFFVTQDGWLHQKRLAKEYANATRRSEVARHNGLKGGRPPTKNNPTGNPNETQGLTQTEPKGKPNGKLKETQAITQTITR